MEPCAERRGPAADAGVAETGDGAGALAPAGHARFVGSRPAAAPEQAVARIVVSACLAGIPCRYDGAARPDRQAVAAVEAGLAVPVCAEVLGGLPTPRPPAEIVGGDGYDVLAGRARVLAQDGHDVTRAFVAGASAVVEQAREHGAERAVLKAKSPSCGVGQVYDGTFSGTLTGGDGVLAAALRRAGVEVESR